MIKNYYVSSSILIFLLIVSTGCTNTSEKVATISINFDSEYDN